MREVSNLSRVSLVTLFVLGCGGGSAGKIPAEDSKPEVSDPVVARANGQDIKQSQVEDFYKFKQLTAKTPKAKASALDGYVSRLAMAGAIQSENPGSADVTQAEIEEFKTSAIIARHFKKLEEAKVTDQAVEEYFRANPAEFNEQTVHVAHILFKFDQGMTNEQRKQKLEAAKNAHMQLKSGKKFAELAAKVSQDTETARSGGDLGWIGNGKGSPQLVKRAQALKPDEVSEPFRTAAGYHIIKLLEPPQTVAKPLEAVRGQIQARLRNELKTAETQRLLAKANIEIDGKPRTETTHTAASDAPRARK
jgi:hypothetical protein